MRNVILMSSFKVSPRDLTYEVGKVFELPFSGVYLGSSIKRVRLQTEVKFVLPVGRAMCICRVLIVETRKDMIIGRLNSIEFL